MNLGLKSAFFTLFLIVLGFYSCTNGTKFLTVSDVYVSRNLEFPDSNLAKFKLGDIAIDISIVSPENIRETISKSMLYDGAFNYNYSAEYRRAGYLKPIAPSTSSNNSNKDILLQGIEEALSKNLINQSQYLYFKSVVSKSRNLSSDKESNLEILSSRLPSILQIDMTNNSNLPQKVNFDVKVKSGLDELNDLKITEIINLQLFNQLGLDNYEFFLRSIFTNESLIPAKETVRKFQYFLPFDLKNEKQTICVSNQSVVECKNIKTILKEKSEQITKKYIPFKIVVMSGNNIFVNDYNVYYVDGLNDFFIESGNLYIEESEIQSTFNLVFIGFEKNVVYNGKDTIDLKNYFNMKSLTSRYITLKSKKV